MTFLHFDPKSATVPQIHHLLLGGVAPRPIALVSTLSPNGINNLSPFSFYNAFGANPPIVAFSPARRGRDGSFKDTYNNLKQTGECVIQAVTYNMVQQVSLASAEYPPDIDEFIKSGLTPLDSELVQPKRVAESPFHMECKVMQIIPLGEKNASGNLVLCEILKFHVDEQVMENGIIHPDLIDLVGRNSADFYTRASGDAIFEVAKPIGRQGIGYDNLPAFVKKSRIFTANNLGQLANVASIPTDADIAVFPGFLEHLPPSDTGFVEAKKNNDYHKMTAVAMAMAKNNIPHSAQCLELSAQTALENDDTAFAWQIIIFAQQYQNH